MRHSTVHSEKIQQHATVYQNLLFHGLYEAQHVLGDTAHDQEPKTALVSSGFAYVKGCWTLWLLDADSAQQPQRPTTFHVCKTRGC
jgi:hypothetical protein